MTDDDGGWLRCCFPSTQLPYNFYMQFHEFCVGFCLSEPELNRTSVPFLLAWAVKLRVYSE